MSPQQTCTAVSLDQQSRYDGSPGAVSKIIKLIMSSIV